MQNSSENASSSDSVAVKYKVLMPDISVFSSFRGDSQRDEIISSQGASINFEMIPKSY
jgi:hypothetical protein